MDWSPPSRRSASRREQNLALIGAVVTGAVIATGVLLLLIARVNPGQGAALRGAALDAVMPMWSVVRAPLDAIHRGTDAMSDYFGAVSRNRALTVELAANRTTLERARALATANAQLKGLLRVVEPHTRLVATARIAGASTGGTLRSAVISAGRDDGVRPGQPVRAAAGLVGRTIEAGDHAARVLLLTDPASRVPVIVERTGQPALLVGANAPLLEIRDRVGAEEPLRPGDRLVTSGDGGVFAPGIPVAIVVRTGEPPLARPAAVPDGLGYVVVETAYLPVPAAPAADVAAVPVPREAGGGKKAVAGAGKTSPPPLQGRGPGGGGDGVAEPLPASARAGPTPGPPAASLAPPLKGRGSAPAQPLAPAPR